MGGAEEVIKGRVLCVYVRHQVLGVFLLYSVYLDPSEGGGIAVVNKDAMAAILAHAASRRLPWVAMGDWNSDPQEIAGMQWAHDHVLRVSCPPGPTCHTASGDSMLDFAVFGGGLSFAFGPVLKEESVQPHTHDAVCVATLHRKEWPKVWVMDEPRAMDTSKRIGPAREELPSWGQTIQVMGSQHVKLAAFRHQPGARQACVDEAHSHWLDACRAELAIIMDKKVEDLKQWGEAFKLKQVSIKEVLTKSMQLPTGARPSMALLWVARKLGAIRRTIWELQDNAGEHAVWQKLFKQVRLVQVGSLCWHCEDPPD